MATYQKKYNPNRSAEWNYKGEKWKLSRSKIDAFIECPRCFYIDNKLGTKRPSIPAFTLNVAVDTLFKSEFDRYRKEERPHPIMKEYGIDAIPFSHPDLDIWRDAFQGSAHTHKETGLLISGAIDDLWILKDESLIVVDYKATSKPERIVTLDDSSWGEQYARQVGVYQWLFRQNGFTVSDTAYFVYANGDASKPTFENSLTFETTLVPTVGDTAWIEPTLVKIKECLDSDVFPESGPTCEYCPYREACGKKLQAIHNGKHEKK
jgi:CRISPR/Cas system-associated exonuclease Cas4 (RecB family)